MSELDNYFQYDPSLMDYVVSNYDDVKYLIQYMKATNIDEYSTGITEVIAPILTEPTVLEYEKLNLTYKPTTILKNKGLDQNLFDVVLQNYGDITKIVQHLNDTNITDIKLYRDYIEYKQDNIENNYTGFLAREIKGVATNDEIMKMIPSGTTIDNYGDYSIDYSSDFNIL